MIACPTMQSLIEKLMSRQGIDLAQPGAYLRLEMKHFDPLVVERLDEKRISVAHYFEQNGDLVAEPDVVFFIGEAEQWLPIEITQSLTGWSSYVELSEDGHRIVRYNRAAQADLADFCVQWAQNLTDQGWLERGQKREHRDHNRTQDDDLDSIFGQPDNEPLDFIFVIVADEEMD